MAEIPPSENFVSQKVWQELNEVVNELNLRVGAADKKGRYLRIETGALSAGSQQPANITCKVSAVFSSELGEIANLAWLNSVENPLLAYLRYLGSQEGITVLRRDVVNSEIYQTYYTIKFASEDSAPLEMRPPLVATLSQMLDRADKVCESLISQMPELSYFINPTELAYLEELAAGADTALINSALAQLEDLAGSDADEEERVLNIIAQNTLELRQVMNELEMQELVGPLSINIYVTIPEGKSLHDYRDTLTQLQDSLWAECAITEKTLNTAFSLSQEETRTTVTKVTVRYRIAVWSSTDQSL